MIDYRTLYLSDLCFLVVYAVALGVLALRHRQIRGITWFAISLGLLSAKTILQSFRGSIPNAIAVLLANEMTSVATGAMYMGIHWFVNRRPLRSNVGPALYVLAMALYAGLYSDGTTFAYGVGMAPDVLLGVAAMMQLLRPRRREFRVVGRFMATGLAAGLGVMLYRTFVMLHEYGEPARAAHTTSDSRLLWSMLLLMLLDVYFTVCYIWFFVVELQVGLQKEARTDSLTGALNRRAMEEAADREVARARRTGGPLAVLLLDLDRFKRLNDSMGHAAGDAALRSVVNLLHRELRRPDLLARSGGEEFIVLLPDTPLDGATLVAERLRQAVEQMTVPFERQTMQFTVSIGVSGLAPKETDWQGTLRRADIALYRAKLAGRNCLRVQAPEEPLPRIDSSL